MTKELQLFQQHVARNGCHQSVKRERVLEIFLETQSHVSAQELHGLVRKKYPGIGYTTVYRTLKMIADSGLAVEVDFNDGVKRFERKLGRDLHAHFICTKCGRGFEVFDEGIKKISLSLAKRKKFSLQKLRYELFGVCRECSRS